MRSSSGLDIPYVNLKAQYAAEKDEIHAVVERVLEQRLRSRELAAVPQHP